MIVVNGDVVVRDEVFHHSGKPVFVVTEHGHLEMLNCTFVFHGCGSYGFRYDESGNILRLFSGAIVFEDGASGSSVIGYVSFTDKRLKGDRRGT